MFTRAPDEKPDPDTTGPGPSPMTNPFRRWALLVGVMVLVPAHAVGQLPEANAKAAFLYNLLSDLVGGIQPVTLGDEEARRRGTQKTVLERKAPPTFDVLVEIVERDRVIVHRNVAETVDAILRGHMVPPESRYRDDGGELKAVTKYDYRISETPAGNPLFALAIVVWMSASLADMLRFATTSWRSIVDHTELFITFGGIPIPPVTIFMDGMLAGRKILNLQLNPDFSVFTFSKIHLAADVASAGRFHNSFCCSLVIPFFLLFRGAFVIITLPAS